MFQSIFKSMFHCTPKRRFLSTRTICAAALLFLSLILVNLFNNRAMAADALVTYPAPTGASLNTTFQVEVQTPGGAWNTIPVYKAKVLKDRKYIVEDIVDSSFAYFDFSGNVNVRVTYNTGTANSFQIRPASYNIGFVQSGNSVTFSLNQPRNLSIEVNGDKYNNLQLYANPVETIVPDRADPNVIYFGPGLHTYQNNSKIQKVGTDQYGMPQTRITVPTGKTLYIAGGAVVQAEVYASDATNVSIVGRGIIDLQPWNTPDGLSKPNQWYPAGIKMRNCSNVKIQGIIVKNPCAFNIYGGQCDTVTIDNFKCISAHIWADGIDMMSSSNVTVSNSFIRSSDDSIAIYGHRYTFYGDALNWNVTNSIFWSDAAHGIFIGCHGSQNPNDRDVIGNLTFKDNDILEVNCNMSIYWGAISINAGDENICRDITFENINVENFTRSELISVKVFKNPDLNPLPGYLVQNIQFKNINYNGTNTNPSHISGYDSSRIVDGVTFTNLTINGTKITNAAAGNILVGSYTNNIQFQ